MRNTCYRISGTNASGKTTVVRNVMDYLGVDKVLEEGKYKVYRLHGGVYVLGSYENACGGLDTVKTFDDTKALARKYIESGDVVMEGILWSTVYKSSVELEATLKEMGHGTHWLQLDTPLDVLLPRLMKRRAAAGNYKDFDPGKVIDKYDAISRTYNKALLNGHRCSCADAGDLARMIVIGTRQTLGNTAPGVPPGYPRDILKQTEKAPSSLNDFF